MFDRARTERLFDNGYGLSVVDRAAFISNIGGHVRPEDHGLFDVCIIRADTGDSIEMEQTCLTPLQVDQYADEVAARPDIEE